MADSQHTKTEKSLDRLARDIHSIETTQRRMAERFLDRLERIAVALEALVPPKQDDTDRNRTD